MSEPVTNAEIEDVLSSIRRLVSDDPGRNRPDRQSDESTGAERLVLTPALRVTRAVPDVDAEDRTDSEDMGVADDAPARVEPETTESAAMDIDAEATVVEPAPEPKPAAADATGGYDMTLEQRIAELEAAINQTAGDWEPDGSEDGDSDLTQPLAGTDDGYEKLDLSDDDAEASDDDLDSADTAEDAEEYDAEDEGDELVASAPPDQNDDGDSEEEAVVAEFMANEEATEDDPDSGEDDSVSAAGWDESAIDDVEPEAEDWDIPAIDEMDDGGGSAAEEPAATPEPEMHDAVEETDQDEAEAPSAMADSTPETNDADDAAAETDAAAERVDFEPADQTAGADTDTDTDADDGHNSLFADDAVLDEDMLRQLVSEMVRDELQGILGERITRNVRRLVRREIQRAFALREFE